MYYFSSVLRAEYFKKLLVAVPYFVNVTMIDDLLIGNISEEKDLGLMNVQPTLT